MSCLSLCGLQTPAAGMPALGPLWPSPLSALPLSCQRGSRLGRESLSLKGLPVTRFPANTTRGAGNGMESFLVRRENRGFCPHTAAHSGTPHGSQGKCEQVWTLQGREVPEPPMQMVKLKVLWSGGSCLLSLLNLLSCHQKSILLSKDELSNIDDF